jgi:uncharacterized membrane protein (DUF373 family)
MFIESRAGGCYYPPMADEKLRTNLGTLLGKAEMVIYAILAVLLFTTALAAAVSAGGILWDGIRHWSHTSEILNVLDQLLVVLMLVEVLHTVNISIRSHILVTEPFLVVGLIASIRRVLVLTLEATSLTQSGTWTPASEALFRESMIELALLGALILILVLSITMLRKSDNYVAERETK